jgi:hypothetical protein
MTGIGITAILSIIITTIALSVPVALSVTVTTSYTPA